MIDPSCACSTSIVSLALHGHVASVRGWRCGFASNIGFARRQKVGLFFIFAVKFKSQDQGVTSDVNDVSWTTSTMVPQQCVSNLFIGDKARQSALLSMAMCVMQVFISFYFN